MVIPLLSRGQCIGVLSLDNASHPKRLRVEQRELLYLLARQVSAAIERAQRYEEDALIHHAVHAIMGRGSTEGNPENLDTLLRALYDELNVIVPTQNFVVALKHHDPAGHQRGWLYYALHIKDGSHLPPYWRPPDDPGLICHVVENAQEAMFLPTGTVEYRAIHKIRPALERQVQSWIGLPLVIGGKNIGVVILEDYEKHHRWSRRDFEMLRPIVNQLASFIQSAWINQQRLQMTIQLNMLQTASEKIMEIAEQQPADLPVDEWLWRATLTLATTSFGFGFDRAIVLTPEPNAEKLRVRMAIGCLNPKDPAPCNEAEILFRTFEEYIAHLQAGRVEVSPLHEQIADWVVDAEGALGEVLHEHQLVLIPSATAKARLPQKLLDMLGVTDYVLTPAKAGDQLVGIVLLDTIRQREPQHLGALHRFDTLTNEVALIYENLRKARAQRQLLDIQHEVLVQAVSRPLKETLERICHAIQAISGADLAAIYPLQDSEDELLYDHDQTAHVGRYNPYRHYTNPKPTTLSRYVLLESKKPLLIEDVLQDQTLRSGERRADAPIIQAEGIRAAITAPIFGQRTGKPRGILYINYRSPRKFTEHDRTMAEAFAHLAATAIGNWRDAQGLRDTQEAREDELRRLGDVLEKALSADSDERQIVDLLLEAAPQLFHPLPVTPCIKIKKWRRSTTDGEPVEIHQLLYPSKSGLPEGSIPTEDQGGISSRAMARGEIQNVPDVRIDPDYRPRDPQTCSELDAPIRVDGQVVGVLNVESPQLAAFTAHHEEMAQRFAHVAALAIGNVRRQRNLQTVLHATQAITASAELSSTLRQIADGIRQAVPNLSTLTIWYKDPADGELALADSYFGVRNETALLADRPREDGMVRYAMTLSGPLWVENVTQNERFTSKNFVEIEGIHSTAVFPLWAQDKAVGVMFFSYRKPHSFTDEEKRLYPILAQAVAASIQDALLLTQARRERQRFELALDVTEAIGTELDQEKAIERVLTRLQKDTLFRNTTAAVLRYDKDEHSLVFTPASLPFYLPGQREQASLGPISVDGGSIVAAVARRSLANRRKEYINEGYVQGNPDYLAVRGDTQAELAISLWSEDKGLIGVLVLESTQPNAFDTDAVQTASLLAKQVRLALERASERDEMEVNNTIAAATAWATEIAHDIEQEIYHISSSVEGLRAELAVQRSNKIDEYLATIDESARRLVAATPPESHRPEARPLDDDVRTTVSSPLAEIDADITPRFDLCCEELEMDSYPLALERILRHLLRNASRAMAHQTAPKIVQIETRTIPERGQVEVLISDNGPGLPTHLQERLFRRRFSRNGNGHGGLGLMLVHFLVKTIGGSVRPVPRKQGAAFAIRLPLQISSHLQPASEDDHE
ncbi:MAG: GAF domain-containing protein [Caldilineaceae bacterium]|nr:GAF domain-containing protein [Caldilineaceae bacterium]